MATARAGKGGKSCAATLHKLTMISAWHTPKLRLLTAGSRDPKTTQIRILDFAFYIMRLARQMLFRRPQDRLAGGSGSLICDDFGNWLEIGVKSA